jgi:3-oxoacyl-(acyl-carrier-protein) synthase
MITALGHNACDNWDRMVAGTTGTNRISLFDPTGYESTVSGEVKDFDPTAYMDRKEARRADRFTQFAFVAAQEALRQSGYGSIGPTGTTSASSWAQPSGASPLSWRSTTPCGRGARAASAPS